VDAPYEPPENPDLILDTTIASIDDLAGRVIDLLNERSPRQPAT
jgi:bifunctional enzyme CysN/CysC